MNIATNINIGSDSESKCNRTAVPIISTSGKRVLSNIQNSMSPLQGRCWKLSPTPSETREAFQLNGYPLNDDSDRINKRTSFEHVLANYRSRRPASKSVALGGAEDDHCVLDLATQLGTISMDDSEADDYYTADSEPEIENDKKTCVRRIKKNSREPPNRVKNRPQKENIAVAKRTVNPVKSEVKKTKKKDSFVVSDDSFIEDDVTFYHQIDTKIIRADIRKMTPKSRSRRIRPTIPPDYDPYSAFIITKRSDSEYSSSEDESTEDPSPTSSQVTKSEDDSSRVHEENVDSETSDSSSSSSSSGSLMTPGPKKKDDERMKRPILTLRDRLGISSDDDSSDLDATRTEVEKRSLTFLQSLSHSYGSRALHPEARKYVQNFKKFKEELTSKLYTIFNKEVFNNQLPSGMKIEWNARLTACAGKCYHGRDKSVVGPNNECLRTSRIVLATKILVSPDRLRDTLIHEMCHAATWLIDRENGGHGPLWKAWAAKAVKIFPELPVISRCHNYSIKTKYKYKCVRCGYIIGRHSKSLKTDITRCNFCHGVFELVSHNEETDNPPVPRFAAFVKEHYRNVKTEKPDLTHKDIMQQLSLRFMSTKILD